MQSKCGTFGLSVVHTDRKSKFEEFPTEEAGIDAVVKLRFGEKFHLYAWKETRDNVAVVLLVDGLCSGTKQPLISTEEGISDAGWLISGRGTQEIFCSGWKIPNGLAKEFQIVDSAQEEDANIRPERGIIRGLFYKMKNNSLQRRNSSGLRFSTEFKCPVVGGIDEVDDNRTDVDAELESTKPIAEVVLRYEVIN